MMRVARVFVVIAALFTSWSRERQIRKIDRRLAKLEEQWAYLLAYHEPVLRHDDQVELVRRICRGDGCVSRENQVRMRKLAGNRAALMSRRERLQEQVPRARLLP